MSVLLPLLAFLELWIISGNTRREPNWRAAFIQAMILWNFWMVISTEVLSIFNAINRAGLSLSWGLLVLGGIGWVVWWLKKGSVLRLPIVYHKKSNKVAALDVLLVLVMVIPLIIGFIAPPNSQEAMSFGMARVAHWAQNQSLDHFAAVDEAQNSAPPGAGISLLNFYVLSGSDRWSNFPAWFAYLGCIQAAMAIAALFNASPAGTRLSALFASTIPIGLTLASGSLDDLPSVLWIMSYALIVFFFNKDKNMEFNLTLAAMAAGLAFITKPLTLIFILPFMVYLVVLQFARNQKAKSFAHLLLSLVLLVTASGGFLYRNFQTYGTGYQISALTEDLNEMVSFRTTLSNFVRNAALHSDIPSARAEYWLKQNILDLHEKIDLDVNDPRTTYGGQFEIPDLNTSEMQSGNPLHLLVVIFAGLAVIVMYFFNKSEKEEIVYLMLITVSAFLFTVLLKWHPTGSRWHLAFFMLYAPIVGSVLGNLDERPKPFGTWLGVGLVVLALPWLLAVKERPIIPEEGFTYPRSILQASREELYFVTEPNQFGLYQETGSTLLSQPQPQELGISVADSFLEYPLWALTGTLEGQTTIAVLNPKGASARYALQDLVPDFVFSDECEATPVSLNAPSLEKLLESHPYCLFENRE